MPFEGPMNQPESAADPAEIISNDPLLQSDKLSLAMIENGFTGPDGKGVDPSEWIEERRTILEEGIPQIDPAKVAEASVLHSDTAERLLSEEGGIPDVEKKTA